MKIYISSDLPKSLKNSFKKDLTGFINWKISHADDYLLQRSTVFEVAWHIVGKRFDVVITKNKKLDSQLGELQLIWKPIVVVIEGDFSSLSIKDAIENSLMAIK